MNVRSLGYVGLESQNIAAWPEIGPSIFGFQVTGPGDGSVVHLRLDDRHHRIAVHAGEEDRLAYLGWEVATATELGEATAHLKARGVEVTAASDPECGERHVEGMVHFRDPAGLRHEVFYGAQESYRSYEPGRRHQGFVTGDQGVGHAVLVVPDAAAIHDFALNTLQLAMTDVTVGPMGKAHFYHVNRRHHSLAVVGLPNMRGLHHVMVQVRDVDDVGIAYDRVQARIESHNDMALSVTLGRHSTDRMLSFYVDTPSGFTLEYGWGALELDDSSWVVTRTDFPPDVWGHKFLSGMPRTVAPVQLSASGAAT